MTGSTAASAAPSPSPSAAPSARTVPAIAPPSEPAEGAPPPTPPDAVSTTVEELPAGFWDDEGPPAAQGATADLRDADPDPSPTPRPAEAPAPARTPPPPAGGPPALASLHGLALLQAVFPGRVTKVERAATADGDAVPDEAAVADPGDALDDEPDPGADAPPPRTTP